MTHLLNSDEGHVQRRRGRIRPLLARALADDVAEDETQDEEDGQDEGLEDEPLGAGEAVAAQALPARPVQVLVLDVDVVRVGRLPAGHGLARDVASGRHAVTEKERGG